MQRRRVQEWVRRRMDDEGYSIRRPTHIAQNAHANVELCMDWVSHVKEIINNYKIPLDCVANMDETCVEFDIVPGTTIGRKGAKTINLNKPKARHGSRLTACLALFRIKIHVIFS